MNSLINIKGVIFDMDGTLLDSMPVWNQVAASYLRKKGYQPEPNLWEQLKFLSLTQGVAFIKKQYGLIETNEEIEKEINLIIEDSYFNEIPMKPGVKAYLQLLRSHDIPMCVATATDKYLAEACLKRLNIQHYFKTIVTCQEVGCGKDTPAIFEKALDSLGTVKGETYVFEDALHAAITAKHAGFRVIGIYDASAEGDWEALRKIADKSIFSMEELL
ncbi:HAD family phosphatase [Sinanaerobacter sp. ZZT-01]|uniref:HAD family hydrolase n=1 Tax=Sinanaerobacter sp. ZZT-01 TaxID=3111540 RepID=UPI002D76B16D|nr:HAD family phosphatase [Sinanaerobacter sp. ZZT-01]WRR93102.1 HAD family phosphatase [Sinanaerobacter sp. ZZT-01]